VALGAVLLEAVSFAYPDGEVALRDVSLSIRPGETLGLLGANGAGKSSLLLQINGALRGTGKISVDGTLLTERSLPEIRSKVGLVFQDPDDQLFMPTVFEDVAFGPRNQGLSESEVNARVEKALRVVQMQGSESRAPHHLSIGQKKRVAVATVLAMDCEVLVLDEPTSGLDPRGRRELARFLVELPQTRLIATHDLELAVELCDRVAVMNEGRLVALGQPREILSDERLMEQTGLEVPHSLRFHEAGVPHVHQAPPATAAH
jgi:cobalt/nickel transport system ATP-binding protein